MTYDPDALVDPLDLLEVNAGAASYYLKKQIGWLDQTRIDNAGFVYELPADWDGKDESKVKTINARSDPAKARLEKLKARLTKWSHPVPISAANIARIPKAHGKKLMEAVAKLEALEDAPFRDDQGQNGNGTKENNTDGSQGHSNPSDKRIHVNGVDPSQPQERTPDGYK